MSFLAAVLASAGEVEMTDLDKNVSELKHTISNFEFEIKDVMEQRYMKFTIISEDTCDLLDKACVYSNKINTLITRIDNQTKREVADAMYDLKLFKSTLEESKFSLDVVKDLLRVSVNLSRDNETESSLDDRIKHIQIAEEILTKNEHLSKLDVYKPLMQEYQRLTVVLRSDSLATWRKQVDWLKSKNCKKENWHAILQIFGNPNEIYDSVLALRHFDSLSVEFKQFADNFINLIVKPIVVDMAEVRIISSIVTTISLKVLKNKAEDLLGSIRQLKCVLEFLTRILPVKRNEVDIMSCLGSNASQSFCNIFKDALFNAVPSKHKQLDHFQDKCIAIHNFNTFLVNIGFFEESNTELIKYTENIDSLFYTKISQLYYDQARTIMKKDLNDLVEVSDENKWTPDEDVQDNGFCQQFFVYPQSRVSKSLIELLDLIDTVVTEMSTAPANYTWMYNDIVNNITIMYSDTVPHRHCKAVEYQPQQSAVLYNNIMYFTRKLAEKSTTYKSLLVVHLLEKLKNLASEILHYQCKHQITQIEKIIKQSDIISMAVNSDLGYSVEKSLSECYNLLSVLSNLWRDILPSTVYCKFMGYSCNGLFGCIVSKIFALEDISATSAEQYSLIFNKIIKDIPTLFPEPKEVHRFVPKWWQLNELVYILSSSMKDIENRWADGKGPLANELTVEQIKCLLKALFQNTDRRAALLKHISATAQS